MATGFEPLLRNGLIQAIDNISERAAKTERAAEGAIARLLARWNEMDTDQKENVAAIVIATATAAVGALAAMKGPRKNAKTMAKKAVNKIAKKLS